MTVTWAQGRIFQKSREEGEEKGEESSEDSQEGGEEGRSNLAMLLQSQHGGLQNRATKDSNYHSVLARLVRHLLLDSIFFEPCHSKE